MAGFLRFLAVFLLVAQCVSSQSSSRRLLQRDLDQLNATGSGVRLGLSRLDEWGSQPLAFLAWSTVESLLGGVLAHDQQRLRWLASRTVHGSANPANGSHESPSDFYDLAPSAMSQLLSTPVNVGSGIYYADVTVGTPAQKFSLIADTGSDLTWVPSYATPKSASFASSTQKTVACTSPTCSLLRHKPCTSTVSRCSYVYGYGDLSLTQGDLVTDTFTIGSQSIPNFVFGLATVSNGTLVGEVGMLGLSPRGLSLPRQASPQLGRVFSYCLLPQMPKNSGKRSSLVFGEDAMVASSLPGDKLQYTPVVNDTLYFSVSLEGISVGGRKLNLPASAFTAGSGHTIFDSGTTLSILPATVYKALKDTFAAAVPVSSFFKTQDLDACFKASPSTVFPSLTFHFRGGADYVTRPMNYLINTGDSTWCLALTANSDISIIGNIQQQDFYVVHDLVNKRIGFAPTDCSAHSI